MNELRQQGAHRAGINAMAGYLLGSFPSGVVLGHLTGRDPRREGEGTPGAFNVWQLQGWRVGLLVYLLDAGKGALAAALGLRQGSWWAGWAGGLGAMVGHSWPLWLGLRGGGRSVAVWTGAGTVLCPASAAFGWGSFFSLLRPLGFRRAATAALLVYPIHLAARPGRTRLAGVGLVYLLIAARFRQQAGMRVPGG